MHSSTERPVEQGPWRKQISVAIAFDDPVGKSGDDRALRKDSAGHAFEAKLDLAGREGNLSRFADQSIAFQPLQLEGLGGGAVGIAINGHRDGVRRRRGDDRLRRRRRRERN